MKRFSNETVPYCYEIEVVPIGKHSPIVRNYTLRYLGIISFTNLSATLLNRSTFLLVLTYSLNDPMNDSHIRMFRVETLSSML